MKRMAETHSKLCNEQMERDQRKLDTVVESMEAMKRRAVMRAVDGKTSNWLTVIPIAHHNFDRSAVEFRNTIAIRYGWLLMRMSTCDGCGAPFGLVHALDCKKEGLVTQCHNNSDERCLGRYCSIGF